MQGRQTPPSASYESRIVDVAKALRFALPHGAGERLAQWLVALSEWNRQLDLTAARSTEELVDLMVADAFVLARETAEGKAVLDVGSGAGGPGLALALARPDLRVTLAEPKTKRVAFLRNVIGLLSAENVTVLRRRGEEILEDDSARFDVAVARAVLPADQWLPMGAGLIHAGGSVWVLLAKDAPPSLTGFRIAAEHAYVWPLTGASRRAVRYTREAPAAV